MAMSSRLHPHKLIDHTTYLLLNLSTLCRFTLLLPHRYSSVFCLLVVCLSSQVRTSLFMLNMIFFVGCSSHGHRITELLISIYFLLVNRGWNSFNNYKKIIRFISSACVGLAITRKVEMPRFIPHVVTRFRTSKQKQLNIS